jgi:pyridoxal phosphate enzyme (YggS family)
VAKRSPLAENLEQVKQQIASACAKSRREPSEVTLIAVTKYAAPEQVREILSLGVADLGESRVQQLAQRAAQLNEFHSRRIAHGDAAGEMPEKLRWHMIGHVQRNKVKQLLPVVSVIHTIDSLRLAEELEAQAEKIGKKQPVLMQINASEESQKSGVAVGASVHLAEQIDSMPHLQLLGLMTMAELTDEETKIRHAFARTREIFEEMKWQKIGGTAFRHLSMGMSHDFQLAILEGATMVRVGSALFGGSKHDSHEEDDE